MPHKGRTSDPATRTEGEGETLDMPEGLGTFGKGQVLGERYQILDMLGRGGMGEVWHALDLKLRVEVALKALRPEFFKSERRLELLRQEVRAAREVMSPNVCRIFDLVEVEGRELVSMEYVDGATLLGVLQERGPLDLKEAQDIASQFLAGLEAIHKAGLIHRDIKPENIMLTRAGRVVVMDFGLARQEAEGGGSVSGTPAYMAPEQAAGQTLDARADVYAAGVVLAEMVCPDGIKNVQSRQSVWEGVRSEPAKVPDTPWAAVIKKAVTKDREGRFNSAHTLTRALEDVTLRVEGAEDLHPYPGLASFTEEDAEYFFGREAEVEQMWRKLEGPPRMLALVGPSGAGKSSFIRAGLFAAAPNTWSYVISTPGNAAISSLGRVMAREMAGDPDMVEKMMDFDDSDVAVEVLSRWRSRNDRALVVVDQFEELFTQNTADEQHRFTGLLNRLVLDADICVVLSMRDDFLMRCRDFEALEPTFADMTALPTLAGHALRRALVRPATKCGYRFEDDELVEEMLAEVEGERGALPLLAFAAARLWERRDRETGLLTREAYHDIGGVGGALARHAEATIDRIGSERIPIVRELFRNLITAEGTRAVREWNELLSVFGSDSIPLSSRATRLRAAESRDPRIYGATTESPAASTPGGDPSTRSSNSLAQDDRKAAAEDVLHQLVDARLLTSYEVKEEDREPTRRVEIIHESLLANWPRLVRWQTQDQEGAQLRDELRQAARAWDEHGRHDDRLWTGTAFREFELWRERYPGGLTDVEEAFAGAMVSLSTRRRRRRRFVAVAAFIVLLAVVAAIGVSRQQAVAEARRAEAAQLVSLGQLELDTYPSATVAYAIASLEQADNQGARHLALKALWKGPTALVATDDFAWRCRFGADGEWLVQTQWVQTASAESLLSVLRAEGTRELLENAHCETTHLFLSPVTDTGHFMSMGMCADSTWQFVPWSMPESRQLANVRSPNRLRWADDARRNRLVLMLFDGERTVVEAVGYDGSRTRLGTLESPDSTFQEWRWHTRFDPQKGRWLATLVDNQILVFEIGDESLSEPIRLNRAIGRAVGHDVKPIDVAGKGRWLAAFLEDEVLMFEIQDGGLSEPRFLRPVDGANAGFDIDRHGRFAVASDAEGTIRLWNLRDTSPPAVFQGPPGYPYLFISDDGSRLTTRVEQDGHWVEWAWSLSGASPRFLRSFDLGETGWGGTKWDRDHTRLARWGPDKNTHLWSLDAPADAEPLVLSRGNNEQVDDISFGPTGNWLATADGSGLALWPLGRRYPIVIRKHKTEVGGLAFAPDGSWIASASSDGTVKLWPLVGDPPPPGRTLLEIRQGVVWLDVSPDGQRILASTMVGGTWVLRPDGGESRALEGINEGYAVAFSPDGRLAAAAAGVFGVEERRIAIWDVASGEQLKVLEVGEMVRRGLQFTSDRHLLSASESGLLRWNVETGARELVYEGAINMFAASDDGRRVLMIEEGDASDNWGPVSLLDLDTGTVTHLDGFGEDVMYIALDRTGSTAVTGDRDGEVRIGLVTGGQPHLFLGHEGSIWNVAIDPLGRWVASGSDDTTLRLWPMPDLSKPPLHTLPREVLIAKLKTLTNLRVVREEQCASGWKLTHDPFPGWETVPTW